MALKWFLFYWNRRGGPSLSGTASHTSKDILREDFWRVCMYSTYLIDACRRSGNMYTDICQFLMAVAYSSGNARQWLYVHMLTNDIRVVNFINCITNIWSLWLDSTWNSMRVFCWSLVETQYEKVGMYIVHIHMYSAQKMQDHRCEWLPDANTLLNCQLEDKPP